MEGLISPGRDLGLFYRWAKDGVKRNLQYRELGNTGIKVSQICFGTLTLGPLQANLTPAQAEPLLRQAMDYGINFFDTAEIYGTYHHLARGLAGREQVVVATKSYAYTKEGMVKSLDKARREMARDIIDIFLLHEQEARTLPGHRPALEVLLSAKSEGIVRAVGISTHTVAGVLAAANLPEVDIIHPPVNLRGLGILDGSLADMLAAIQAACNRGKGIYAMKPLGGGHLLLQAEEALRFVFTVPGIASVAVGMQCETELLMNITVADGGEVPQEWSFRLAGKTRRLHVEEWCIGCGECIKRCEHEVLFLKEGTVHVLQDRCVFCGYCASVCPEYCLKVF